MTGGMTGTVTGAAARPHPGTGAAIATPPSAGDRPR